MAKLFVSYSRKDSVAARRLIEAFKAMGLEVWVDWEAIPPAVDWLEQIFRGIEEADAFIFMISPDSIASEVCKVEVGRALLNNKRIIPIVLRDVHAKDTQDEIRKLNWTYIRETDNFEEGLAKVKTAIELDLDWLEEHRRLQVRALEWHRKKDTSLLLHGRDLRNARHMIQTYTSKDPIPTELQQKYIEYSYRTERTRRIMWFMTGITLLVLTVLTIYAVDQTRIATNARIEEFKQRVTAQVAATEANEQRIIADHNAATARSAEALALENEAIAKVNENKAQAQRSAARAQIYQTRPGELYTSTLLGIDSLSRNPTSDEAEEILRTNISLLPRPVAQASQGGKINAIAYNAQSETFATASQDGSVCGWDVKSGKEIFCTTTGGPAVNAVAFSPDGTQIIAGDQSGRAQILSADNGAIQYTIYRVSPRSGNVPVMEVVNGSGPSTQTAVDAPVRGVSFKSPDGRQVAVAYDDGQFPVFYPADKGRVSAGLFTGSRPNVFALSPNGRFLAVGSADGSDSIWDLNNNVNKFPTVFHRGGVQALAFSPDNSKVATGGNDNTVAVISMGLKKELFRIFTQSAVRSLAFSPNNEWLATASDERIQIWSEFGNELLSMSHGDTVTQVIVSPNSRLLGTIGEDRTARVWDATTGSEMFQIPVERGGAALAFSNDSQALVVTDQAGGINIWDLSALEAQVNSIPFEGSVNHVQYSPSGEWAAVSDNNQVWLLRPNSETGLIPNPSGQPAGEFRSNVDRLVFSPNSKYLGIFTNRGDVALYNTGTRAWQELEVASPVLSIAFSPDSQQYIVSTTDGGIQAWDLESGATPVELGQDYPGLSSLAANSQYLAFGLQDKIEISAADGNGGMSEIEAPGQNTLLASNADGSRLAATDSSGRIHIWSYQDGTFTSVTSPESDESGSPLSREQAASLAFSPDGKLLAVGTASKVFLIDALSGDEIARIPHRGVVRGLSFSPDGKYLTTASSNFIQQWEVDKVDQTRSDELIQKACSLLIRDFSGDQLAVLFGDSNYQIPCD